jgi:hypothetical protein
LRDEASLDYVEIENPYKTGGELATEDWGPLDTLKL